MPVQRTDKPFVKSKTRLEFLAAFSRFSKTKVTDTTTFINHGQMKEDIGSTLYKTTENLNNPTPKMPEL